MSPRMDKKDFYNILEASEILNLPIQTIKKMCENGKFEGATHTPKGKWLIPKRCFSISLEEARKLYQSLNDLRQKAKDGGEVDEF